MLRPLKDLHNFSIRASDGEIGHVKDFYFDDDAWVVRYLVVDTGTWLSSRQVLITPIAFAQPDWLGGALPVSLTQAQVRDSPSVDTDQPVSRQNESQVLGYYGYPMYWEGGGLWGDGLYPYALAPGYARNGMDRADREQALEAMLRDERARHRNDDPHLRSCKEVDGYHLQATDGEIGHVSGFLVDDETWAIRYLVVDTSNWWLGHQVLIAPSWIQGVHWSDRTVAVDMSRDAVKSAPAYDGVVDWGRDEELALYQHHARRGYWAGSV